MARKTQTTQKITLSASRDIPAGGLLLSQSNVRHVKAGISIEELAEDIARRTLLASLTDRPVLDECSAETGMFEIPAGGRRYRALELLVKQKRLAHNAPVPCIVRTDGLAEEDSLDENVQRAPLHPLDQFRAFQAMRDKGRSEEEIAAAFFVAPGVVRQRLKLAAVSPALLEAYAEEAMTLDQLMAFTVNPDTARREQVWEALPRHYSKAPHEIRRMLTEGAVRVSDKRAQFVGLDAYVEAGGAIMRDLFQQDDGGWLQGARLLDLMVSERLAEEAAAVRAEGWKLVEVAPDFSYGHSWGMRRLRCEALPMSAQEEAAHAERPLSDRLVTELIAHRTLALRDALARDSDVALVAAQHAMALRRFYRYALDSCVEIEPRNAVFGAQAPGLGDMACAQAVEARHEAWVQRLPKAPEELREALAGLDADGRAALFAHCVALTVNEVHDPYHRRPRALAHGEVLATTLGLDMERAGWAVTAANYLGRVTKARILEAVREAKGATGTATSERRMSAPSLERFSGGTGPSRAVLVTLEPFGCGTGILCALTA